MHKVKENMNCTYKGNNQGHLLSFSYVTLWLSNTTGTLSPTCGWDSCLFVSIYVGIFWYLALSLCLRLVKFLPVIGIICRKWETFQCLLRINSCLQFVLIVFLLVHPLWLQIYSVHMHYSLLWDSGKVVGRLNMWCLCDVWLGLIGFIIFLKK